MSLIMQFTGMSTMRDLLAAFRRTFFRPIWIAVFLIGMVINGMCWWFINTYASRGNNIPLHYSYGVGIDLIGPWGLLYHWAIFGAICVGLNLALALMMVRKDERSAKLLIVTIPIIQCVILAGLWWVVRLGGSAIS